MMSEFYSQYGQDQYIYNTFFKNKTDGVFVDIGAYDGIKLSNSYFFEKLGWTGFCFEPVDDAFQKLISNRSHSKCFNCAIGHENKKVQFLKVVGNADMLSGVLDYYDANHMFRINKETYESNGEQIGIEVEMFTLDHFLPINSPIDYLSIDTEGGESKILKNILENFNPKIISVEVNYEADSKKLFEVLDKQYEVVKNLGCDLILKDKKW